MKGIAVQFNDIIRKQLKVYAAWLPITNNLKLGDYGVIAGGIFEPIGNIEQDFGVSFTGTYSPGSNIDFKSAGTKITKLSGGVKVNVIPAGAVDASINLLFEKEASFFIKSPDILVSSIPNPKAIAKKLMEHPDWENKYKVDEVYFAREAVIISTIENNTEISFSGDVEALNNLQLGKAGLQLTAQKSTGLNIHGKEGVIGLGLFRIKNPLFGKPDIDVLRSVKKAASKAKSKEVEIEVFEGKVWKDDM